MARYRDEAFYNEKAIRTDERNKMIEGMLNWLSVEIPDYKKLTKNEITWRIESFKSELRSNLKKGRENDGKNV